MQRLRGVLRTGGSRSLGMRALDHGKHLQQTSVNAWECLFLTAQHILLPSPEAKTGEMCLRQPILEPGWSAIRPTLLKHQWKEQKNPKNTKYPNPTWPCVFSFTSPVRRIGEKW